MIGYNEYGHPEFDTVRSDLGELVYRLKYKADKSVLSSIVEASTDFINTWKIHPDVVVPTPPSRLQRAFQPVTEIASELAKFLGVALDTTSLRKIKPTAQMKDVGDFAARVSALETAFACGKELAGRRVLLVDDLFQSGATMNVAARILKQQGLSDRVYALALTRTRN
jgi:competence protein ComFC